MLNCPCADQKDRETAEDNIHCPSEGRGRDPSDIIVGRGAIGLKRPERMCPMGEKKGSDQEKQRQRKHGNNSHDCADINIAMSAKVKRHIDGHDA